HGVPSTRICPSWREPVQEHGKDEYQECASVEHWKTQCRQRRCSRECLCASPATSRHKYSHHCSNQKRHQGRYAEKQKRVRQLASIDHLIGDVLAALTREPELECEKVPDIVVEPDPVGFVQSVEIELVLVLIWREPSTLS